MSNFDVSLLPVLPDGGASPASSGAFGGVPEEAPPDAFAQLLEQLAGGAPHGFMRFTKGPVADGPVGDADLEAVALSTSADGWERAEGHTVPESTSDDQNQEPLAPVALMAMAAPLVLPDVAEASRNGGARAKEATGHVPVVAGESAETPELTAAPRLPGVEREAPFEAATGRDNGERSGKLEARAGEKLPGLNVSAENASRELQLDPARLAAIERAAAHTRIEGNGAPVERGAGPVRESNAAAAGRPSFVEARTAAATAPVIAAESSAEFGRRGDSRGEQQPGLASRIYEGSGSEPGAQPVLVDQSFSRAVASAAQSLTVLNVAGVEVPGNANALESQIVQGMRRLRKDGADEIRVTLRPEYLGSLTISLRVEHDSVTAVMHVDEPQVRAWVQAHESQLRQAMSSQGLTLERLVVTDERPGSDNRERDDPARQGRRPNRQRNGDAIPNFEVVA